MQYLIPYQVPNTQTDTRLIETTKQVDVMTGDRYSDRGVHADISGDRQQQIAVQNVSITDLHAKYILLSQFCNDISSITSVESVAVIR